MNYDYSLDLSDEDVEGAEFAARTLDDGLQSALMAEQAASQPDPTQADASAVQGQQQPTQQQPPQQPQQQEQPAQEQPQTDQQRLEAAGDSRANDTFEWSDIGNELVSIGAGGLRDTGSSLLTLPERIGDMISGEAGQEGYDGPSWDPLGGDKNPITTTWWGQILRGGVHFGSMVVGTALAIKGAALAGLPGAGIAAAATGTKVLAGTRAGTLAAGAMKGIVGKKLVAAKLAQGAVMGGVGDVISEHSQEDNAMGALVKHFPALDNPLATKDTDSPSMKMFKNIVEGMGIGMVFDGLGMIIGRRAGNPLKAVEDAQYRIDDIEKQTVERGMMAIDSPDFDAYKNAPISDPQQGAATSTPKTLTDALEQRGRMAKETDQTVVSMDSVTTPAMLRRAENFVDMTPAQTKRWYKELFGEGRFDDLVSELKSQGKNPDEVFEVAYEGFKDMIDPMGDLDLDIKEFGKLLTNDVTQEMGEDAVTLLSPEKVVMIDLINASNTKQIRDRAIAAREIGQVLDVNDVDGPVSVIAERLAFGIEQVKTSRALWSEYGRRLQTPEGRGAAAKAFKEKKAVIRQEAQDGVNAMVQILNRSDNNELTMAALEAFSMAGGIKNMEDLFSYFSKKLKGGEFNGKVKTGRMIKELQGVFIHSVLSGPKTPVRAVLGTGIATFTKPFSQALGALAQGDSEMVKESMSVLAAYREALPEAFKLFKSRLSSYWTGDMETNFKKYKVAGDNLEWEQIKAVREFRKEHGEAFDFSEEASFQLANMARNANNTSLLTYGTKIMAATDDAFGYIMARMHSRKKAFRAALDNQKGQPTVDNKMLREYEDKFYSELLDDEGNINWDANQALKFEQEEATLTRDMSGFAKGMADLAEKTPWAKPFFLFARTGVNGIELTMKHMPGFSHLVKDERRIANATAELAEKGEYRDLGIETVRDLEAAKALRVGRQTLGMSMISMAGMMYMSGNITGNGPQDRQQRKLWMDAGWKPRSIKDPVTGTWISYDAFEPFGSMLSWVADVGDYQELMGPEWTEKNLFKMGLVMAQGMTQKSYLAGMQQFVDLASAQPGQMGKMLANLANNTVPLSSLRNELGKVLNPYMKELNGGFMDSIRNRNQLTEYLSEDPLPVKYDILNGKPINNSNWMTRMFNAVSPVQFNLDYSDGKKFLFESKYDLRMTAYHNPDNVDLSDYPAIRSMYQRAIGNQNLEKTLGRLYQRPDVKKSLAEMEKDLASGRVRIDPKSYLHNDLIAGAMRTAQRNAWAQIAKDPKVANLIRNTNLYQAAENNRGVERYDKSRQQFDQAQALLQMPIK